MAILFDQEKYIESAKGIIKEFLKKMFPDYDLPLALPDLADDNLSLEKPVVYIEFNNSMNIDGKAGRATGRGGRLKRKSLRFSFQILTTGENSAVLERDRISQKLEYEFSREMNIHKLASVGLKDVDIRYINSYRVREGVHLARLELYTTINLMN
ncbi:hypothetical protein [Bacillus sp. LMB3902]|uniref:hypothetical protein n=1 Tax=Bacillus sp. LMB3902 TaxID=3139827 RepID=UPI00319307E2